MDMGGFWYFKVEKILVPSLIVNEYSVAIMHVYKV
jgi:hypothetical protein